MRRTLTALALAGIVAATSAACAEPAAAAEHPPGPAVYVTKPKITAWRVVNPDGTTGPWDKDCCWNTLATAPPGTVIEVGRWSRCVSVDRAGNEVPGTERRSGGLFGARARCTVPTA